MTKGISVIVPVYNREKLIYNCIQSILQQEYKDNLEIIISDDGSTDRTLEIAQSFADKHIIILNKPVDCKTQGASGARNRGIAAASCNYISFLDSDDYYLPGYLKIMAETLDSNNEIGYTFCRSMEEFIDSSGDKRLTDWTRTHMSKLDKEYNVLNRSKCINTNVIMVKKAVFEKIGDFNTNLTNGGDSEMWMRIGEQYKNKFIEHKGAVYRTGHGNPQLTANSTIQKKNCSAKINTEAFARNYTNHNCDKLRLFLIIRALIYERMKPRKSKIGIIYTHLIVLNKLFTLSPSIFFKFIKLHSNR